MKTTDSTAIGLFVVGGVIAFLVAILFFTTGAFWSKDHTFVLYFKESVNGLEVGAPVKIRGVCIGQVRKVAAHFDPEQKCVRVPVTITLEDAYFRTGRRERLRISREDRETLLERVDDGEGSSAFNRMPLILGMVGSLQMESFVTGKLFVDLNYEATLANTYLRRDADGTPEIPTKPSNLASLSDQLNAIAEGLSRVDYATIGGSVEHIFNQLANLEWRSLANALSTTITAAGNVIGGEEMWESIRSFGAACHRIKSISKQLSSGVEPLMEKILQACQGITNLAGEAKKMFSEGAAIPVGAERFLRNAETAAAAVRIFFEFLEQNPNALLLGRPLEE
ncbi:MAG: MlaD family protein [Puniceicoccales bacterium]|jgi:paraquat-inducible protein B|nr:MlaD family protein [Puniceicoccales bacterium]